MRVIKFAGFYVSLFLIVIFAGNCNKNRSASNNPSIPTPVNTSSPAPATTRSKEFVKDLKNFEGSIRGLAFSPDGKTLVVSTEKNGTYLLDFPEGGQKSNISNGDDRGQRVVFAQSGKIMATLNNDGGKVKIIDLKTTQEKISFEQKGIHTLAFSTDGNLFTGGSGGLIVWDTETGKPKKEFKENLAESPFPNNKIALSPEGNLVASASQPMVKIWNTKTGELLKTLSGFSPLHYINLNFSADGNHLISYSQDSLLRRWNIQTGEKILEKNLGESDPLYFPSFSGDGRFLAGGGNFDNPQSINIYDTNEGKLKLTLTGHGDRVSQAIFSPENKFLVSVCYLGNNVYELFVWDISSIL